MSRLYCPFNARVARTSVRVAVSVVAACAVASSGVAAASAATVSPDDPIVATSVTDIPLAWLSATPPGTCVSNPFMESCADTLGPTSAVVFPSASELARLTAPIPTTDDPTAPDPGVSTADSPDVGTTTEVPYVAGPSDTPAARSSVKASKAPGPLSPKCDIEPNDPKLFKSEDKRTSYYMFFKTHFRCSSAYYTATEGTSTLYRAGIPLKSGYGKSPLFGSPTATAAGTYDCRHTSARTYVNRAFGVFHQKNNITTAGGGDSNYVNHTCPR